MLAYILLLIISIVFISSGLTYIIVSLNYIADTNYVSEYLNLITNELFFWLLPIGIFILIIYTGKLLLYIDFWENIN